MGDIPKSARRPLRAGEAAPDFTLDDAAGGRVSLRRILAAGPAVVTFLASGATSRAPLAACAAAVAREGAVLLALVRDAPRLSPSPLTLLHDRAGQVAARYGMAPVERSATFVVARTGLILLSLLDLDAGAPLAGRNLMPVLAAHRGR